MRLLALLAVLLASSLAPAFGGMACADGCATEDCGTEDCGTEDCGTEGGADGCGSPDERESCPPGCNAGCACCAAVSALPITAVALGIVRVSRVAEYAALAERAPRAPEPRAREVVPRHGAIILL